MREKEKLIKNTAESLEKTFSQDELNSILLHIFEKKTEKITATNLWHQYQNNRFTTRAAVNQKALNQFDYMAYALIPDTFDAIELSPVTLLGLNRWLTPISQKNVLATIRKSELVSDTATALVPEIIKKIRVEKNHHSGLIYRSCSSHRCLRMQDFSKNPGFTSHFRVFSLASAWHRANKKGLIENLFEHLNFYLSLLIQFYEKGIVQEIYVEISHIPLIEAILHKHNIEKKTLQEKTQTADFSFIQEYQLPYSEHLQNADELLKYFDNDTLEANFSEELACLWKEVIEPLKVKFIDINFGIDLIYRRCPEKNLL